MTLRDKLLGMTKDMSDKKNEEKEKTENERLDPIRKNIKKLQEAKRILCLIKGSLDFKSNGDASMGMGAKDYAVHVGKDIRFKTAVIDRLMAENKEVLEAQGIETRDQLLSDPEFANDEEVKEYYEALKQVKELEDSDDKLKEKLAELGVDFDEREFSYEAASKAIAIRLEGLNDELVREKLKTPEGGKEVIDNLAESLKKKTGKIELQSVSSLDRSMSRNIGQNQPDFSYGLQWDNGIYERLRVEATGDKLILKNWTSLNLIPKDFAEIESTYGKETAEQALKKSYQNKVHEAFAAFDRHSSMAASLCEQMKAISPEEMIKTREMMREFIGKQAGFLSLLRNKSEELKKLGCNFNPEYNHAYGEYRKMTDIDRYGTNEEILGALDKDDFPPRYNFVKLQEVIKEREASLDAFISLVENIKSREDAEDFLGNMSSDNYVGKVVGYGLDLTERAAFEFEADGNYRAVMELTDKCRTYQDAEEYLKEKIKNNSEGENRVFKALKTAIDVKLKRRDLERKIKEQDLGNSIPDLEYKIKMLANEKETAIRALAAVDQLQAGLPQEEDLILQYGQVIIPSLNDKYENWMKEGPIKRQELAKKSAELEKLKTSKPILFGKDAWQAKLDALRSEVEILQTEITELGKTSSTSLYEDSHRALDMSQYSKIWKMIKEQEAVGKASEIFVGLRAELAKVKEMNFPPDILEDLEEYKILEKKIS